MKKTRTIILPAVGIMALTIGCSSAPNTTADCVRKGTTQTYNEDFCENHGSNFIYIFNGTTYRASDGRTYVRGGSYRAPKGHNIVTRGGTTVRGGFGGGSKGGGGS